MESNNARRDWRWDGDGALDGQYIELREVIVKNGPSAGRSKLVFDFEMLGGETVSVWETAVLRSKFKKELQARSKADFEPGERIRITPTSKKEGAHGSYRDFDVEFEHAAPKRSTLDILQSDADQADLPPLSVFDEREAPEPDDHVEGVLGDDPDF